LRLLFIPQLSCSFFVAAIDGRFVLIPVSPRVYSNLNPLGLKNNRNAIKLAYRQAGVNSHVCMHG